MLVRLPDLRPVRTLASVVGLTLLAAAAGCGAGAGAPTVPSQPSLTDHAGAVENWEFHFNLSEQEWTALLDEVRQDLDPDFAHSPSVHLAGPPGGWDARVVWSAAPCQRAPWVRIGSSGGRIDQVVVAAGPDIDSDESLAIACPDSFSPHALDLRTEAAYDDVLILLLWDDDDLVANWVFHPDIAVPPDRQGPAGWARRLDAPTGWDVRVAWAASPCQRRPTVSMVGPPRTDEPLLLHRVRVQPGPHLASGECSAVVWHALDLRLATEVASGFAVWRDPASG